MENQLDYELLKIEWAFHYNFGQEPHTAIVRDESNEDATHEEHSSQIKFDAEGIPTGNSHEDEKNRREIIYTFIKRWKEDHIDSRIFNHELNDYITINQTFLIEASAHAAKSYLSTKAVMRFEQLIRDAQRVGISKPKPGNKNQSPFQEIIVMKYHAEDLGTVKLTVGVRFKTHNKVQYGISVPPEGQPLIDPSLQSSKKRK